MTEKNDQAIANDHASVNASHETRDKVFWHAHSKVEKYHGVGDAREAEPYEVVEADGNILVNAGITAILNLMTAEAAPTAFSEANGYIGVGSGTANPTDPTQTDLTTPILRVVMEAGYPIVSGSVATFRSVFSTAGSDGVWAEWGIFNAAAAGTMLNRKVTALGTKAGGTWTLTVTITLS
jgi:hypothetical protein